MTFSAIQTEVLGRANLTTTAATTRVGSAINRHYRRITSLVGLDITRWTTIPVTTTSTVQAVTFTEIERIARVRDVSDATDIRVLAPVSLDEILSLAEVQDAPPTRWALRNVTADDCVILMDTAPTTTYDLTADGWTTLTDLSGSNEPAFAESFHDILTWSVLAEEYGRKEKLELAQWYQNKADELFRQFQFYMADNRSSHAMRQGSRA